MSLKHDIVIKNEFSVKGSRGATPGDYIKRYMSRDDAVEPIIPTLYEHDLIAQVNRNREIVAKRYDKVEPIRKDMKDVQKLGGIAFSASNIALSNEAVNEISKTIQDAHDEGKTVLKTVLSFDTNYLKEMGIIADDDEEYSYTSGWRGRVDQLRLRKAIQSGMSRLARRFDDLEWIGTIQVDARHVHCHIAAVDLGRGRLMDNGEQKGKLTLKDRMCLRRFLDNDLQETSKVKFLSSDIGYARRNVRCLVKSHFHELIRDCGTPQFLLACLPDDKRLWRAASNRVEMKKPNAIATEFVKEILVRNKSTWDLVEHKIDEYARTRAEREGLSIKTERTLIRNGKTRVINEAVDGIYQVLKRVENRPVSTPLLDVMSTDLEQVASLSDIDPIYEFGFRLRSYKQRLDYHTKQRREMNTLMESYQQQNGQAQALYDFYALERQYQAMCMTKYLYFLRLFPTCAKWKDELDSYVGLKQKYQDLNEMINDPSIVRMDKKNAEDYGLKVYKQHGGRLVRDNKDILALRSAKMGVKLERVKKNLQFAMSENAFSFDDVQKYNDMRHKKCADIKITSQYLYEFDDVKMMDIHHLAWDFTYDADISRYNIERFGQMADDRYDSLEKAQNYLEKTEQSDAISLLPVRDIVNMKKVADDLRDVPVLYSQRVAGGNVHHALTTEVNTELMQYLQRSVLDTMSSYQDDPTFG